MNRKSIISCGLVGAALLWILLTQPNSARAQSLMGFRVGDTPSKLSKMGPVSGEDEYKGMDVFKWILSDRNVLSATVDREGEIVYVESDWGGRSDDTRCDLGGLKFGVTTLADLRKRFGSNGFGFKQRPHVTQVEGGVVLLNSWEAGDVVVTFYTRISGPDYEKAQAAGEGAAASFAKLDGISLANTAYATSEWGKRVLDPAYKKIEWK